ncbi:MAG TPA: ribonuclease H [Bacteroidales bacterium]
MNPEHVHIFTDGSCHTQIRQGAWVAIILHAGAQIILKGEAESTTHNRMELIAVIKAIEYVDEKQFKGQLIVYTDSQYVCRLSERKTRLRQNHFLTNKGSLIQNTDLIQALIRHIESHNIRFIKVKAHQKTDTESSIYSSQADMLSRKMVRNKTRSAAGSSQRIYPILF